jgi:hypothetical protein
MCTSSSGICSGQAKVLNDQGRSIAYPGFVYTVGLHEQAGLQTDSLHILSTAAVS